MFRPDFAIEPVWVIPELSFLLRHFLLQEVSELSEVCPVRLRGGDQCELVVSRPPVCLGLDWPLVAEADVDANIPSLGSPDQSSQSSCTDTSEREETCSRLAL